ncbi:MAG: BON domain-containing protein [Caldisericales bacterium]|nr:BON domain-containing protein [Caldisericales bacterium]
MEKKFTRGSPNADKVEATKTAQSLLKKLSTLLEKRKIVDYSVKLQKNKVLLVLPTMLEEEKREKLVQAIMELQGSENIKIQDQKGPARLLSDEDIEDQFRISLQKYIPKETKVSGSVKDGVMTVYGTTTSAYAREAILDLAKETPGVKKVVDQTRLPMAKSDIDLANSVMLELGNEAGISVFHLQVMARNGNVFVTGNAKDDKSVKLATDVVSKVPGVKSVENAIRIPGETITADDKLRDKIFDSLVRSPSVRARDIKVAVVHGNVFLRGYAASTKEIIAAESMVSSMPGVKKVYMELEPRL